jgi:hypothetical protein
MSNMIARVVRRDSSHQTYSNMFAHICGSDGPWGQTDLEVWFPASDDDDDGELTTLAAACR